MNIFTITLNPAYDVHCRVQTLVAGKENRVLSESRIAGGKGVNISRTLSVFDVPNTAVIAMGKENDSGFLADLAEAGVRASVIPVEGRIRENYTFHPDTGPETRISFPGACLEEAILDRVLAELPVSPGDFVTFSGSIPQGIAPEFVTDFLRNLHERGARVVVDSGNYLFTELKKAHPHLIKPNEEEVARMAGREIHTAKEVVTYAGFLARYAEKVVVSLGKAGAVLLCGDAVVYAKPPAIDARSTVGAGDSMIAGFLIAETEGKSAAECLLHAVAFGTASCLREGTLPPLRKDVARMLREIEVVSL